MARYKVIQFLPRAIQIRVSPPKGKTAGGGLSFLETYGLFEMLGRNESALRQGFCFAKTLARRRSGGSLALAEHSSIYRVSRSQRERPPVAVFLFLKKRGAHGGAPAGNGNTGIDGLPLITRAQKCDCRSPDLLIE